MTFPTQAPALAAHALASQHQVEADRLYALVQGPPNTEQTTLFAYDGAGHLLGEYDETGTLIREHLWLDDLPLASFKPDAVYLIQADHLNTPVSMTDLEGTVVWRGVREAFGATEVTAASGVIQNLRFPGQYYDQETGLHQNWNREYDPGLGRYTQSDPIGLQGGLNTFAYVDASPVLSIDPSGLRRCSMCRYNNREENPRIRIRPKVAVYCSYICSCWCENSFSSKTVKFEFDNPTGLGVPCLGWNRNYPADYPRSLGLSFRFGFDTKDPRTWRDYPVGDIPASFVAKAEGLAAKECGECDSEK